MKQFSRIAKGKKPVYFNEVIDVLIDANLAMASEISVLRERLQMLESVAAEKNCFTSEDIENYVPGPAEREQAQSQRAALISRIFSGFESALLSFRKSAQDER